MLDPKDFFFFAAIEGSHVVQKTKRIGLNYRRRYLDSVMFIFFFNLTQDRVIWEEAMEAMPPSACPLSKSVHHFLLVHCVRGVPLRSSKQLALGCNRKLQAEPVMENKLVSSAPLWSLWSLSQFLP